jgi:hypothetical protein
MTGVIRQLKLVGATPTALRGRAKPLGAQGTPTQSRGRGPQSIVSA